MSTPSPLYRALQELTRAALGRLAAAEPQPAFTTAPDLRGWRRSGQDMLIAQHRQVWAHPPVLSSSMWWNRLPQMADFRAALADAGLADRVDTQVGVQFAAHGRPLAMLLVTEVLDPLVADSRSYSFDPAAFDTVARAFEAGLRQQQARVVDLIPLLGFDAADAVDLSLPGGVVIRMMSERELSFAVQVLGVPVESMSGTNTLRVLKVNQHALVKTHTFPLHVGPITGNPTPLPLPDFDPDHVITALRLAVGGSVSLGRPIRVRHPDDFDAPGGYSANNTAVAPPDPSRSTIVYDPVQMDLVRTLAELLGAPAVEADRVLRMALRRIVTAGGAAPPEDRLVDLLIAAEALLIQRRGVPRGPKKVPMAEGTLEVLANDPQFAGQQEQLRALVYCAYERRNHEMHADVAHAPLVRLDGSATEDLAAVVGDLESVMRRVAVYAVAETVRTSVASVAAP